MITSHQNLFLVKNETSSNILFLLNKFLNLNINVIYFDALNQVQKDRLLSFSQSNTLPIYQEGDFVISGSFSIVQYLLSLNNQVSQILVGNSAQSKSLNSSWVEFSSYRIQELDLVLLAQNVDKEASGLALKDLEKSLEALNNHLQLRTFLNGYQYSLSDLAVSTSLRPYFEKVIGKEQRDKYCHVTRWFNFCSSLSEVTQAFGYVKFL